MLLLGPMLLLGTIQYINMLTLRKNKVKKLEVYSPVDATEETVMEDIVDVGTGAAKSSLEG